MSADERVQMRVIFNGMVQGVGFRYSVVRIAEQFPVTGFVRNEWDGSVYLLAEGDQTVLQQFLAQINGSRLQRYIHGFNISWNEAEGIYPSFTVKR